MFVLSSRRDISTREAYEPKMREFLRTKINLEPEPEVAKGKEEYDPDGLTPRRSRLRSDGTSSKLTRDDLIANKRRAFELRHLREMDRRKKASEREWQSKVQYQDWRSKQARKGLERRFRRKDRHILEDVIHERNEYYLESIGTKGTTERKYMSHTRTLPPEMRAAAPTSLRTFYWGA